MLGLPALPLIALPHPLAGNDAALVRAKAQVIADEIERALIESPGLLEQRYLNQFQTLTERRLTGGAVCVDTVCAIDPALTPHALNTSHD